MKALARGLVRTCVEARGFQVPPDVSDDRRSLLRERDRAVGHEAVHVVDAEPNPFEMKCRDRAVERFRFVDERFQLICVRRVRAQQSDEIGNPILRRLAAVGGHVGIIVECPARTSTIPFVRSFASI